jgi:hypothetical protein
MAFADRQRNCITLWRIFDLAGHIPSHSSINVRRLKSAAPYARMLGRTPAGTVLTRTLGAYFQMMQMSQF